VTGGGHAPGTGRPGATEFPATWSREQITERLLDVARYPDEPPRRLVNGLWHTTGVREGVRIVVLVEATGSVRAAFPVAGPGVVRNPGPDRPTTGTGDLDDADRELCGQLDRAGEWGELDALLTAQCPPAP
jgi:hypothetical protein